MTDGGRFTVELETADAETTARRLLSVLESSDVTDWTIERDGGHECGGPPERASDP